MAIEDLTTWALTNPNSVLSVTSSTATATSMSGASGSANYISKDQGGGFYSGGFTHRCGPVNVSAASSNNSRFIIMGIGTGKIDNFNNVEGSIDVVWLNTTTNPTVYLTEFSSTNTGNVPDNATTSATYQNSAVGLSTNFWIELSRSGTTAKLIIYSDTYSTILQTLSFTLTQSLSYEFDYVCGTAPAGTGATVSCTVKNVDLAPSTSPPMSNMSIFVGS